MGGYKTRNCLCKNETDQHRNVTQNEMYHDWHEIEKIIYEIQPFKLQKFFAKLTQIDPLTEELNE